MLVVIPRVVSVAELVTMAAFFDDRPLTTNCRPDDDNLPPQDEEKADTDDDARIVAMTISSRAATAVSRDVVVMVACLFHFEF